jgi:hypothetical protein
MPKIRSPTRIAHATDDEESARYALQGTLVTPDGFAVATDGHIAACIKVQVDGLDAPIIVPQELGPNSKADLKAEYHANGEPKCEKHSVIKGQCRVEHADVRDGRFPKVGEIFSGMDASKHLVLVINANFLWRLAQAINVPETGDVVTLLIPKPEKDGLVENMVGVLSNIESCANSGGFGILMPCDADAAQARADFNKLREAAATSLDAAAKTWSDQCVARSQKQKETEPVSESSESQVSPSEQSIPIKPRRKAARKRSAA